ncbi:hypothetical protein G7A66_12625 [Altererythrobacter sp. SALINAS58]|uniref:hypothetical protein n=1 Tax=Alteripontixanthobacter muriae TaxID=2705546 RepID=UPI001575A54D|nr:hypothetical protein [Alteripontixanthobacter muriae]NTZ43914.1 hypothetical protein [Alteripontixanthobacter muriae]
MDLTRWTRKSDPGDQQGAGADRFGQLVAGDALFLKLPETFLAEQHGPAALRRYLAVLLVYRRYDLILWLLANLPEEERLAQEAMADTSRKLFGSSAISIGRSVLPSG